MYTSTIEGLSRGETLAISLPVANGVVRLLVTMRWRGAPLIPTTVREHARLIPLHFASVV